MVAKPSELGPMNWNEHQYKSSIHTSLIHSNMFLTFCHTTSYKQLTGSLSLPLEAVSSKDKDQLTKDKRDQLTKDKTDQLTTQELSLV